MKFISEITRVKELMGLISEQKTPIEVIYYQKCEGGDGLIDPDSFKISDLKTKEGKMIIKFTAEPNPNFNDGDSKSIPTCLGGDIPLTGRCFRVGEYGGKKIASMEVDCTTGEDL